MTNSSAALVLGLLMGTLFFPGWAAGLTTFWGDLTAIHYPWRALAAQLIQSGRLPLWNPYLYFGMPMGAQMQSGIFYPGGIVHLLFGFASGTVLFQAFHYWLAGWLMYLWLRRVFPAAAALGGAAAFAFGGGLISRHVFLNHLAVLSLSPAFFLFFGRPGLLASVLALAFLAGFPPLFIALLVWAWALRWAWGSAGMLSLHLKTWVLVGAAAAAAAGVLLAPAFELVMNSRRSSGVDLGEALRFGFTPSDLAQWVSPLLVPLSRFHPGPEWWKCCYIGFAATLVAVKGLCGLPRRRAAALLILIGCVVALILGESNPLSRALWSSLWPLKFLRYPGNFSFLAGPIIALLVASGLASMGRPRSALLLIALELMLYGRWSIPWAPRGMFSSAGPLASYLQEHLGDHRYLLSPTAMESGTGLGAADWRQRLYGATNAPFRLRAAGSLGEPLVPASSYIFMDALYSAAGAQKAAELFPWADIGYLLTPSLLPPSPLFRHEGARLWEVYRFTGAHSRAVWFSEVEGELIPAGLPRALLPRGRPLVVTETREDRFAVAGEAGAPGWVFVSHPRYPGWSVELETLAGRRSAESRPALAAFQKIPVPEGPWKLYFLYHPAAWRYGALLTLLGLSLLAARGLRRLG